MPSYQPPRPWQPSGMEQRYLPSLRQTSGGGGRNVRASSVPLSSGRVEEVDRPPA